MTSQRDKMLKTWGYNYDCLQMNESYRIKIIPCQMSKWVTPLFCILMKFGTVKDLSQLVKNQEHKKIFKNFQLFTELWSFKKRYFCLFCIIAHA